MRKKELKEKILQEVDKVLDSFIDDIGENNIKSVTSGYNQVVLSIAKQQPARIEFYTQNEGRLIFSVKDLEKEAKYMEQYNIGLKFDKSKFQKTIHKMMYELTAVSNTKISEYLLEHCEE